MPDLPDHSLGLRLGGADRVNLLDIYQGKSLQARRASSYKGGEYHGPCPVCGGVDRFHIWPQQGEHGSFWCRQCGKGGDAIAFLRTFDGLSYRDACTALGRDLGDTNPPSRTTIIRRPAWQPEPAIIPGEQWQAQAEKLTAWAHQHLLAMPEHLQWLAGRGIGLDTVKTSFLGWNPGQKGKDLWRPRQSWGLPEEINEETGKPRRLWFPQGLVIPCFNRGQVQRLRIRRPAGEPRYYVVPGSSRAPLYLARHHQAVVVVESELDALALAEAAGDLLGVYAIGNSSAKPDADSCERLREMDVLLIATDFDEPDAKGNRPGAKASRWWLETFPRARRWPPAAGKDPGEMHQAGISLREWIRVGIAACGK